MAGECSSALEKKKTTVADQCAYVAVRNVATHNTEETDDLCARCAKAGNKQAETVAHIQRVQCVGRVEE